MSTPPKDPGGAPRNPHHSASRGAAPPVGAGSPHPKPGNPLESTFLGVAPAAPGPAPAVASPTTAPASPSTPAGGSAIIAAPTISVSGERKPRQPVNPTAATLATAAAASPAAPLRPAALQGGWQSAGVARPQSPDQTALHGSPGAWPMPPAVDPARPQTHVGRAAPPGVQHQPPPPAPPLQQPPLQQPAAAPPGGLQHTALASDYLRAAREAALGGVMVPAAPRAITPPAPAAEHWAARAPQPVPPQPPPYVAHDVAGPPTQPPVSDPVPTAPPAHPVSMYPAPPSSVAPPASSAPPTAAPPITAPLSEPGPLPLPQATYQPVVEHAPDPELHGPRSIGTQASIAPPLQSATGLPVAPAHAVVPPAAAPEVSPPAHAGMAPAPNPVRAAAPSAMAGTMLDRTPSIPGSALGAPATAPPASSVAPSATAAFATRFEQVPSARGSLAQQQTGFGLHIPIDQSAADWGRANLEQTGAGKSKDKPPSPARLIVLAALAVAAIGFAAFGKQLFGGNTTSPTDGIQQRAAQDENQSPKQATLTNLPGSAQPAEGALPSTAGALPSAAPAAAEAAAAPAVMPSAPVQEDEAEPVDPADAKAREAARKNAEAAASPESRLAAQAARHVLVARYADALPLYRQLQQSYPQNTVYAAMVRVLEQKTAPSAKQGAQP